MAKLGVPLTRLPGFHQVSSLPIRSPLSSPYTTLMLWSLSFPTTPAPTLSTASSNLPPLTLPPSCSNPSAMTRSATGPSPSTGVTSFRSLEGSSCLASLRYNMRTFLNWYLQANYFSYSFNTRLVAMHPYQKQVTYYVSDDRCNKPLNQTVSRYARHEKRFSICWWSMPFPAGIETDVVFKKTDMKRWDKMAIIPRNP